MGVELGYRNRYHARASTIVSLLERFQTDRLTKDGPAMRASCIPLPAWSRSRLLVPNELQA
jgi:hypothetical protein